MDKRFQIVTDSSCDLPQELADKLELLVLPLHFTIGGKTYANYLDGREIGFHDFFERIRQGEAASTSAVNPESFREVMEQTLQQGLDILFVGFSSGLSTTYQSGCIAADDLREKYPERKILTVDSLCASLGQGLYVYLGALQQQAEAASVRGEEEFAEALLRYHRGITFLSGNTITPLIFNAFRKVNLEFWRGYIRGAGTGRCLETLRRFTDYIERGEGRAAAELLREGLAQFRESI